MRTRIPRPAKPSASAMSHKQIDLTWEPSPDAMAYMIERRKPDADEDDDEFVQIATVAQATCHYSDTPLFPDTVHRYRIKAVFGTGATSPYSMVAKATTHKRAPMLKRCLDEVKARLARDPNDIDALCHKKAIDAATSLYGWGYVSELRAIDGYLAAKGAILPDADGKVRFSPEKCDLGGFLYSTAQAAMKNAARDEAVIRATGMPRVHDSKEDREQILANEPWVLRAPVNMAARGRTKSNTASMSVGERLAAPEAPVDIREVLDKALAPLALSDRILIEQRLEGATVAELAAQQRVSEATIERRLKGIELSLHESGEAKLTCEA
jgi:hypothetical protein